MWTRTCKCGTVFTTDSKNRQYCDECNEPGVRRARHAGIPKERYYSKEMGVVKTECICPRCGAKYSRYINWTGRGTPRYYCNVCMYHIEGMSESVVCVVSQGELI